jgi:hypothetical protein
MQWTKYADYLGAAEKVWRATHFDFAQRKDLRRQGEDV